MWILGYNWFSLQKEYYDFTDMELFTKWIGTQHAAFGLGIFCWFLVALGIAGLIAFLGWFINWCYLWGDSYFRYLIERIKTKKYKRKAKRILKQYKNKNPELYGTVEYFYKRYNPKYFVENLEKELEEKKEREMQEILKKQQEKERFDRLKERTNND